MIQKLDWDTNFFGYNVGVFKHKRNDVFDFELSHHNMGVIETLNTETRIATNPDDMN